MFVSGPGDDLPHASPPLLLVSPAQTGVTDPSFFVYFLVIAPTVGPVAPFAPVFQIWQLPNMRIKPLARQRVRSSERFAAATNKESVTHTKEESRFGVVKNEWLRTGAS